MNQNLTIIDKANNQNLLLSLPLSKGCRKTTGVVGVPSEAISPFKKIHYNTQNNQRSKTMSRNMTLSEKILWFSVLSKRQFCGLKFIKQKQIFSYILDFYCAEKLLSIEVDGQSHNDQIEYDIIRTKFLNSIGIKVIRVNNDDVINNLTGIMTFLDLEINKL